VKTEIKSSKIKENWYKKYKVNLEFEVGVESLGIKFEYSISKLHFRIIRQSEKFE